MKCPQCRDDGQKSSVQNLGGTRTLLGGGGESWDEEGHRHYHDVNTTTWLYKCSNGHMFSQKARKPCPYSKCSVGKEEFPIIRQSTV